MMGYRYQNKPLYMDRPWTDKEGTNYPANWLRNSTKQQRDQVPGGAITWEPD